MVIPEPTQIQEILDRHTCKIQLWNTTHTRLREDRNTFLESLAADNAINNLDDVVKTAELHNEIEETDLEIQEPLHIILTSDERSKHDTKWRIY